MLSPRSCKRHDGHFECCSECFNSLKPSKKDAKTPPRHAIANGLAIGHIPSVLMIDGKDEPRQKQGDTNKDFSDIMSAAVSQQRLYGFIFAFMGGAHESVMGQFSFFEMDQSFVGGAINHYQAIYANDHILCVMVGRFTPNQRVIAQIKQS